MKKWFLWSVLNAALFTAGDAGCGTSEIRAERLADKIRGGLLGQLLGNLNGLPHEFEYIDEPGNVETYVPGLPDGARTDDDTDLEWVYIRVMEDENTLFLPPERISALWKRRINRRIWCSNLYARQLMDLDIPPPYTGMMVFNPWAEFNISGQFVCETFGLICPGMPRTASRLGLNHTRVTISGEPAQATQLFDTMIAVAFFSERIEEIVEAGLAATDPRSEVHRIVRRVRGWVEEHPDDWRKTRRLLKEAYTRHGGRMRDRNGYELNTGAAVAALLYGRGDFTETLRIAFNFGWDCDNTAATAGTILGVVRGYRWMLSQEWQIVDRYRNTTREDMPGDETITSFADRILLLAERMIVHRGGKRMWNDGVPVYRIVRENPECVLGFRGVEEQAAALRRDLRGEIVANMRRVPDGKTAARTAYYAICLDMDREMRGAHPEAWDNAVRMLNRYDPVLQALFHHAPIPLGDSLRVKAVRAGLKEPEGRRPLWE